MNLLSVSLEWEQRDGDGAKCSVCKDPIFSKMYVLMVKSGDEQDETKFKMCESCYFMPEVK